MSDLQDRVNEFEVTFKVKYLDHRQHILEGNEGEKKGYAQSYKFTETFEC